MNYYDLLGIEKNASADQIKSAFRTKARHTHPDAGGDPEDFKKLNEAYETLKDPSKRAEYDHVSSGAGRIHVNINGNPHNIFSNIFQDIHNVFGEETGPFASNRTYHRQNKNRDLSIEYTCRLEDTLQSQEKQVSVKHLSGERKLVQISIPVGAKDGQRIKYTGLGDTTMTQLTPGDLYVTIKIVKSNKFEVQGNHLYTDVTIDCFDAILGSTIQIQNLQGKTLNLIIPAGTQTGTQFSLKQQGLYEINNDKLRGNLVAKVHVKIPQNLTPDQLNMLRSIRENR